MKGYFFDKRDQGGIYRMKYHLFSTIDPIYLVGIIPIKK